jgi:phosphonate transport system substrate-binding protein
MRIFVVLILLCLSATSAFARPANPPELVVLFQRQKDPAAIKASADKVADYLGAKLNRKVTVVVPGDYAASVQALVSERADVAYLSSLPYLLARRDAGAKLLLAETRAGPQGALKTSYDSVFVVRKDSPLKTWADVRRESKKLRMAFTSSTSTSGYVFPYARLVQEKWLKPGAKPDTVFAQTMFAGGYTQALEQVVAGRADIAAVSDYTMEGPKADVYLDGAKRADLRIISRTPGVPTHVLAVRKGLDAKLIAQLRTALIQLAKDYPALLSEVYGAQGLAVVKETAHVQATISAIKATQLPIDGLVK